MTPKSSTDEKDQEEQKEDNDDGDDADDSHYNADIDHDDDEGGGSMRRRGEEEPDYDEEDEEEGWITATSRSLSAILVLSMPGPTSFAQWLPSKPAGPCGSLFSARPRTSS